MTTLTDIDIDYDKLLDSPTKEWLRRAKVPETDERRIEHENSCIRYRDNPCPEFTRGL